MSKSFDLYFCVKAGRLAEMAALGSFWRRHPAFTDDGWYHNPDTGVYFSFCCEEPGESFPRSSLLEDVFPAPLTFSLSCERAGFFALEAMPLVEEACRRLGLLVIDPQESDIAKRGPKPAQAEELVASWERVNRLELLRRSTSGGQAPFVLDTSKTLAWWRFQMQRTKLQERLGNAVLVPNLLLMLRKSDCQIKVALSWDEAMPCVFAPADLFIISRWEGERSERSKLVLGWAQSDLVLEAMKAHLRPIDSECGRLHMLPPEGARAAQAIIQRLPLQLGLNEFKGVAADEFVDSDSRRPLA